MKDKIIEAFKYYQNEKSFFYNETELVFYIANYLINQKDNGKAYFEMLKINDDNKDKIINYNIDLVLKKGEEEYLFEFKFVRDEFKYTDNFYFENERNDAKGVFSDIERLEYLLYRDKNIKKAYVIVYTNSEYLISSSKSTFLQNSTLDNSKVANSKVILTNNYLINWEKYCTFEGVDNNKNKTFNFLILEIQPRKNEGDEIKNK